MRTLAAVLLRHSSPFIMSARFRVVRLSYPSENLLCRALRALDWDWKTVSSCRTEHVLLTSNFNPSAAACAPLPSYASWYCQLHEPCLKTRAPVPQCTHHLQPAKRIHINACRQHKIFGTKMCRCRYGQNITPQDRCRTSRQIALSTINHL